MITIILIILLLSIALIVSGMALYKNLLSGGGKPPSPPSPPGPSPHPSPSPPPCLPPSEPGPSIKDENFDMFFPPYDCPTADQTMIDLQMIQKVIDSAKASNIKLNPHDPNNPFQIKYSVYNLYDKSYLNGLINAFQAGVYVQVLIQYTQAQAVGYNHIWSNFHDRGMNVLKMNFQKGGATTTQTQKDITDKEQFVTLNLIPINITKLMHIKTRYYKFGPDGSDVVIDGKTKHIKECIVTGSFNPECAATLNNEFLFVISSNEDKTPTIIANYLRIYEFTKRENTKFECPEPDSKDPIYNINNNLNVIYSRWCKNSNSYMRYILSNLIDNESDAILLPLYSLSNLDSPFMYEEGNFAKFKDKIGPYNETTDNNFTANIKIQGISSQFGQWGVSGAGSLIEINYTDSTNKIKTYKTYIRDVSSKDESVLVTSTKYAPEDGTKINSVTIYKTLMTNFDKAIRDRGVKIILLIDKSQLDGEIDDKGKSFTGGDITLTGYILSRMGAILYRCTNPLGELHSKSGYFYSQNILISDTTNWSNAGMGSQNKTSPSCSINAETCLVINGNKFDNPNLFRTRVLANFMNTVRMYEYQQICPPEKNFKRNKIFIWW